MGSWWKELIAGEAAMEKELMSGEAAMVTMLAVSLQESAR